MSQEPALARPVVVHGLAEALTALDAATDAGRTALLVSPPGAAGYAGAGWFRALTDRLAAARPGADLIAVLDCADRPGWVLAALRAGIRHIRFAGDGPARPALAEIAAAHGATLWREIGPALEMRLSGKPAIACRAWMAGEALPGLAVRYADPPAIPDPPSTDEAL
jgi:hypothetical protein